MYLHSVVVIYYKSRLVVSFPSPQEFGVLFEVSALPHEVVATAANPKLNDAFHEGQVGFITS